MRRRARRRHWGAVVAACAWYPRALTSTQASPGAARARREEGVVCAWQCASGLAADACAWRALLARPRAAARPGHLARLRRPARRRTPPAAHLHMYGNIGLSTPRGSGTSGHVTANKFNVRPRDSDRRDRPAPPPKRGPNADILDHDRRRAVEVKLAELEDALEDQGYSAAKIAVEVAEMRKQLTSGGGGAPPPPSAAAAPTAPKRDTHADAARKEAQLARARAAFGVRADYEEGAAFSRGRAERAAVKAPAAGDRGNERHRRKRSASGSPSSSSSGSGSSSTSSSSSSSSDSDASTSSGGTRSRSRSRSRRRPRSRSRSPKKK